MIMRPSLGVLAFATFFLACQTPREPRETIRLEEGLRLERTFDELAARRFCFELGEGQLLELEVEQIGLDVIARAFDAEGQLVFETDRPIGATGVEELAFVADRSETFCLQIEPFRTPASGAFAVKVVSLRPATSSDRRLSLARMAFARGERRRQERDLTAALTAWHEALTGFEAEGDLVRMAETRWQLGLLQRDRGESAQARAFLQSAAAALRAADAREQEARVLNDLGELLVALGEMPNAEPLHMRAVELARSCGAARVEATALNELGRIAELGGDLTRALDFYERSLAVRKKVGPKSAEAITLQNLGNLQVLIGRDEEAQDLLEAALALLEGPGNDAVRARVLISLGWLDYLMGKPEEALFRFDQAETLLGVDGDPSRRAGVLDRKGTTLKALGRLPEAEMAYRQALEILVTAGNPRSQAHTLANLGWLALENGQLEEADARFQEALAIFDLGGEPAAASRTRLGRARVARLKGRLDLARAELEKATPQLEAMRERVLGALSRDHFIAARYEIYEEWVALLMEMDRQEPSKGHAARALEVAERARGRGLLERLVRPGAGARQDDRTESLLAIIADLERQRSTIAAKRPGDPRADLLANQLRSLWLEVEKLDDTERILKQAEVLNAAEIQALAGQADLFVFYFLAEPESFVWTVDRRQVGVHRLAGRALIEGRARRLAETIPRASEVALAAALPHRLAEVSELVLDPIGQHLAGHERLFILPDGVLHLVPFAALPDPTADDSQPLIRRHGLSMLPSFSLLASQRRQATVRRQPSQDLVIIADPVFSTEDERVLGAPAPVDLPQDLRRSLENLDVRRLERLPGTAEEALAIRAQAPSGRSLSFTDFAADRRLIESGILKDSRILHFATHGLVHSIHPSLSGLVLSLVDPQGQPRDGFLRAHEIAGLDLAADLAVLSACQTGSGREIRGEGLVGLTQAFFAAGVRRQIVSLWQVDDGTTPLLMSELYRQLFRGRQSPSQALRKAQLARLDSGNTAALDWAAFVVIGDGF